MKKIIAIALLVASLCTLGCSNDPPKKTGPASGAVPSGTGAGK